MGRRDFLRRNRQVQHAANRLDAAVGVGGIGIAIPWTPTTTPSPAPALADAAGGRHRSGSCRAGVCGREAACMQYRNSTYTCVCPHDNSPPTGPDMRCPNRSTVPLTPSPIHNIIPPVSNISLQRHNGSLSSTSRDRLRLSPLASQPRLQSASHSESTHFASESPHFMLGPGAPEVSATDVSISHKKWAIAGGCTFGIAFILAMALVLCYRRKDRTSREHQAPRNLSKGPLGSEHFLPNPQYSLNLVGLLGVSTSPGNAPAVDLLSRSNLTLLHDIGEGCFGKVFKGELRLSPDQGGGLLTVAVKVLKDSATKEAEEDFMREVEVMSSFKHPHILRLIGVVPKEPGAGAYAAPCMVFEFMPYGDLTEVLRSSNKNMWEPRPGLGPLTQEALINVALQIALGMSYLAAQRFVHRDLACRNCLVGRNMTVKIADFGMSRDVYTCDYYKIGGSRLLPVRWMSPEALLYGRFTLESDVWSFGVVLWEVLTRGRQPYYGHANEEVVRLILNGVLLQPPEDCPPQAVEVMRCCWRTEPRHRLGFPEICSSLEEALSNASVPGRLPRPPSAFPACPPFPDDLAIPDLEPEEALDPDNYLLPKVPSPGRCQYIEPLAD